MRALLGDETGLLLIRTVGDSVQQDTTARRVRDLLNHLVVDLDEMHWCCDSRYTLLYR